MRELRYLFMAAFISIFAACTSSLEELDDDSAITAQSVSGIDLANNLWDSFKTAGVTRAESNAYPSYYGGMYLEKDNLVVLTCENSEEVKEEIADRCKGTGFKIMDCDYSYSELSSLMDELTDVMKNTALSNELGFISCSLLDKENRIEIQLADCSRQNIDKFKSVASNSPCLTFVQGSPLTFEENIYSGSSIGTATGYGSVAYRAKMNGKAGFVTSGHVMKQIGNYLFKDDRITILGECKACSYTGTVDAAFCELSSGFIPINQVQGDFFTLKASTTGAFVGMSVNLGGRHNHSKGKVVSISVAYNGYGGTVMTKGIASDYASEGGDSGGIVYDNSGYPVGVHVGKGTVNNVARAICCSASEVNSLFLLTMY